MRSELRVLRPVKIAISDKLRKILVFYDLRESLFQPAFSPLLSIVLKKFFGYMLLLCRLEINVLALRFSFPRNLFMRSEQRVLRPVKIAISKNQERISLAKTHKDTCFPSS